MYRISLPSVLLLLVAATAGASVIEVPLTTLHGNYPATRLQGFQLEQAPSVINSVSIRVTGVQTPGSITCESGGPFSWPMAFTVSMSDEPNGYWIAGVTPDFDAVSFSQTTQFQATNPGTTWSFLIDGAAEVTIDGWPAGLIGSCYIDPAPPTGVINEAVLIIDAEYAIKTEPSTWGKIKALYRR